MHTVVRMEQQHFSEVEVDKVVASSNNMEVEELVVSSNNMEVEVEVMANHEHVLCSLDALVAGVLEPREPGCLSCCGGLDGQGGRQHQPLLHRVRHLPLLRLHHLPARDGQEEQDEQLNSLKLNRRISQ